MKQYLSLLQKPVLELQTAIELELTTNPALEILENEADTSDDIISDTAPESDQPKDDSIDSSSDELDFQETLETLSHLDEEMSNSLYSEYSNKLESIDTVEKKHDYQETLITQGETLADHLLWQLGLLSLSDKDYQVAEFIIGMIDESGYLTIAPDTVAAECTTSVEDTERIIAIIQAFDPPGVCARTLQECLLLQLADVDTNPFLNGLATLIVRDHFDLLQKRDTTTLIRNLGLSDERASEVLAFITSLEPKPGRAFTTGNSQVITPDATIHQSIENENEFTVEIHNEYIPQLRINKQYRRMLADPNVDTKTKEYIKSKINGAIWFMKAVDQRKSTLHRVTEKIIEAQSAFLVKGFAFLKPLRLRDIADEIELHESTISRALAGKYVCTPQGTMAYKTFFSNKMQTTTGDDESQTSIMERIKALVTEEDPRKPLSDSKLLTKLGKEGIIIARRTVAKYREMLKILPSHLRKIK